MHRHSEMVSKLAKSGAVIARDMTPGNAHLLHMVLGIAGEAGELVDAIKKAVIYGKEIDMDNVIEELGDLEFYMEGLRHGLAISRERTLIENVSKLTTRYPNWDYTDQSAIDRVDKDT